MESFPSLLERTVASALLLLSAPPPSLSPLTNESKISVESEKSLGLNNSKSCSSIVTNDDCSSPGTRAHPLRMIAAAVARCHEMELKVVRKSRSKKFWRSDTRKLISVEKPAEDSWKHASETTEASSCLSSSSSAVSSARSGGGWKESSLVRNSKTKQPVVNSSILRRRAEDIKRVLSNGCISEVRIRKLLGDSPDTSKALRMLLKQEKIKRSGAGGRSDPYLYTGASVHTNYTSYATKPTGRLAIYIPDDVLGGGGVDAQW